jgi:DNA polymerase III alpha subunit
LNNDAKTLRAVVHHKLKERSLDKCSKKYLVDGREVTYLEQTELELDRFISKGFASYFLITHLLVKEGNKRGWPFSPRGSAGGSLVVNLLGISTLDPLKWNLSFDRFLSESRGGFNLNVKMPEEAKNEA